MSNPPRTATPAAPVDGLDAATASAPRLTHVAAAVLLRPSPHVSGGHEFLLAQRPPGKAYAGYWEFPGGKVEPGETTAQALLRELQEELGIDCQRCYPWLTREFVYPHAHVRIRFFRIPAWKGTIAPLEHTGFVWVPCGGEPTVAPMLPANTPILRGLALPGTYAITCAEEHGIEDELARVERGLAAGLRLIQVRDKTLEPAARRQFAEQVLRRARPVGAQVLINDDVALARAVGADGVHLSAAALRHVGARPELPLLAASCHDADELARAVALDCDFAALAPVLPTATHPGSPALGWERFAQLVEQAPLPVFALGGLRAGMADLAMEHGAHGVAMMRGWG